MLGKMTTEQSYFQRKWTLAGLALSYARVKPQAAGAQRNKIEDWLRALADAAPEPWDELLRAHHEAFLSLTGEISRLADDNRELLAMSHQATQETLMSLQDSVQTYDVSGQAAVLGEHSSRVLDRSI